MPNDNYANEPNNSRAEDIIQSILDNTEYNEEARSRIEYLLIELKNALEGGGGSGFTPTAEQIAAMNSGINAEDVEQITTNKNNILSEQEKTTGMTEGGSNYITVNGIRVYVSATAPTGARTGDLWIGG